MIKIDRLDVDAMQRIRETDIWQDFEKRIRDRHSAAVRTCCNGSIGTDDLRRAQGEVAALQFVLALPDAIQKEVVRRTDGTTERS